MLTCLDPLTDGFKRFVEVDRCCFGKKLLCTVNDDQAGCRQGKIVEFFDTGLGAELVSLYFAVSGESEDK